MGKPNKTEILAFIERHRDTLNGEDLIIFNFLADLYLSRGRGARKGRKPTLTTDAARRNREAVARHRARKNKTIDTAQKTP